MKSFIKIRVLISVQKYSRLLRSEGYGQTLPFYIIEMTYLLMFLFLRGPFCTYLIYHIMQSDILDMDEKIVSLVLYLVSLALVFEILSYVTRKYKNKIDTFKGLAYEVGIVLNDMP